LCTAHTLLSRMRPKMLPWDLWFVAEIVPQYGLYAQLTQSG